ncbi:threonyl-carbamoyl synthesis 1 [Nomia melanderi]|uniref:threonyl-carbamoyl synthesis 1 n=1 Tax=Nomia melanderi TaxID=2448451 RepID=UPI00130478EB|nr:yrdC domain-containing protein, mitochondrial [Nomia melanderi]
MARSVQGAKMEINQLENKLWICKGKRSAAIAIQLLKEGKVIAIPTDTIYGLAVDASKSDAIKRLYQIKKRDMNKPLCVCVSDVQHIPNLCVTDHLPTDLINTMLPGPYTIVLKRKPALNKNLNPDTDTVGIRVPNHKFIRLLSHIVGPLALTSANVSNAKSCLYAEEFQNLWPVLDGIFVTQGSLATSGSRTGSTIVDLSIPEYYRIVRFGTGAQPLINVLKYFKLQELESNKV